ncbi:hypothetical protein ABIB62_003779 [Mucilaginibacter sp. UYP25]|uniref:hypothetical protein n=1 Tax=unclassified Mucilaginibacter TaxID=2617802 RepID=UPI00339A0C35
MNDKNLRVIKTARSEKAINEAVAKGYWPLVKPVVPSPKIKSKYAILQDPITGQIEVIHDYRALGESISADGTTPTPTVIDFTYYYPHHFENPFAAYLIPKDLKVGEVVWLEDLIEDIVSGSWNQGDAYRLQSCEAKWDGKDLIINFKPLDDQYVMVG